MPFYYHMKKGSAEEIKRTADGLLRLREQLAKEVPPRTLWDTLLLATWNIREFDSQKYGPRLPEAYLYMAEIVSHFDLVAIQEVRDDLTALNTLRSRLGSWWDYICTDVTEGLQGNHERLAFLYDTRKVRFSGLAGEVVMPPVEDKGKKVYLPAKQLYRTPFICGFRAAWAKFALCTAHIRYGEGVANDPDRVEEIKLAAEFLAARAKAGAKQRESVIVLGDFNVFSPQDKTLEAMTKAGFQIPPELQDIHTNLGKTRHYDQIGFMVGEGRLGFRGRAGAFDFAQSVFRDDQEDTYLPIARANRDLKPGVKPLAAGRWPGKGYGDWRTYQVSDHLPLWVELKVEFGEEYLKELRDKA